MKRNIYLISLFLLAALAFIFIYVKNENLISEKYIYEGSDDENWKVNVEILNTQKDTYKLTTNVQYIGTEQLTESVTWKLKGSDFGTG